MLDEDLLKSLETPYLRKLLSDYDGFRIAIDRLLEKYKAQPAGNGYIDLILDSSNMLALIDELSNLPVAVASMTWWCLCTPDSKLKLGCPHGYGGPVNSFGAGWFS